MLACQFIAPGLGIEKGDNKIRGHWFWNSGLRHLLRTSPWDSGKFQAEPVHCCFFFFFFVTKKASTCSFNLHFYALIIRFFSEIHTQAGIYDWLRLWPMVTCKFCYQEYFCAFINGKWVYITNYTDVLLANIFLDSVIWE